MFFVFVVVLNTGAQNEAIERNISNKENQKKQLLQRIDEEKKKPPSAAVTEEVCRLCLDLDKRSESIGMF